MFSYVYLRCVITSGQGAKLTGARLPATPKIELGQVDFHRDFPVRASDFSDDEVELSDHEAIDDDIFEVCGDDTI